MMAFLGTTDVLTSGSSFVSERREAERADSITGSVFASHAGTLLVQQSGDGVNWDIDDSITVSAATKTKINVPLLAAFWRLNYTNGGTNQTTFRLFAKTNSASEAT